MTEKSPAIFPAGRDAGLPAGMLQCVLQSLPSNIPAREEIDGRKSPAGRVMHHGSPAITIQHSESAPCPQGVDFGFEGFGENDLGSCVVRGRERYIAREFSDHVALCTAQQPSVAGPIGYITSCELS